ncbi:MAG: polysaccharide export protein [Prevotella sp.]|nr:polysaccharide export protein [Prevotella sp.]
MKKIFTPIVVATMILMLGSCASTKKVAYFQNINEVSLEGSKGLFDAKIMPKDMLTITVSTTDPKAATPFNLTISGTLAVTGTLSTGANSLQTYLVDNDGEILYPVIGKINVSGMTVRQCEEFITAKIKPYLSSSENPVVTVRMSSYRVSVIGEVTRPGVISVASEKMSVLEALAQAGDLTIYGKRDNVMLIREDATGQKSVHILDLNDANIINSPYYYLQQNDIIYVEPNKVKAQNASVGQVTTLTMSAIGVLVSVASLMVNILRK